MKTLLLLAVLLTTSCQMPEATPHLPEQNMTNLGNITRHYDTEAGVVCWIHDGAEHGASISCLPIDQTELGEK